MVACASVCPLPYGDADGPKENHAAATRKTARATRTESMLASLFAFARVRKRPRGAVCEGKKTARTAILRQMSLLIAFQTPCDEVNYFRARPWPYIPSVRGDHGPRRAPFHFLKPSKLERARVQSRLEAAKQRVKISQDLLGRRDLPPPPPPPPHPPPPRPPPDHPPTPARSK